MELHTYYEITVDADGNNVLSKTDDPTIHDGYSREPLVYVDPDDDSIDNPNLPFTGVTVSFMGEYETVDFLPVGAKVTDELDNQVSTAGVYYYRTGVYEPDETHTGFDAIVWVIPDSEDDDEYEDDSDDDE